MTDIKMTTAILVTKHLDERQEVYYGANLDSFETSENKIKTIMPNVYNLVDGDLRNRTVVKKGSNEYNELTSVIVSYMTMIRGFNDVL